MLTGLVSGLLELILPGIVVNEDTGLAPGYPADTAHLESKNSQRSDANIRIELRITPSLLLNPAHTKVQTPSVCRVNSKLEDELSPSACLAPKVAAFPPWPRRKRPLKSGTVAPIIDLSSG